MANGQTHSAIHSCIGDVNLTVNITADAFAPDSTSNSAAVEEAGVIVNEIAKAVLDFLATTYGI